VHIWLAATDDTLLLERLEYRGLRLGDSETGEAAGLGVHPPVLADHRQHG